MKRKEKKHPEITDAKELAKREKKNRFGTNAAKELDKQLKELQDFTNVTTEQLRFSVTVPGDCRSNNCVVL